MIYIIIYIYIIIIAEIIFTTVIPFKSPATIFFFVMIINMILVITVTILITFPISACAYIKNNNLRLTDYFYMCIGNITKYKSINYFQRFGRADPAGRAQTSPVSTDAA